MKKLTFYTFAFTFCSLACTSEMEYSVFNSYIHRDNLEQQANGNEGYLNQLGVTLDITENQPVNWEFNLQSSFSRLDYSRSQIISEDILDLTTTFLYRPQKSNFTLTLLGDVSQAPANRFQTQEVNNSIESNLFAISPNYFIELTPISRVNLNYQHSELDFDSQAEPAFVQNIPRLEQRLSAFIENDINPTNTIAIVWQRKDTDFDFTTVNNAEDFITNEIFARWQGTSRSNQITFEYGKFKVVEFNGNRASEEQGRFILMRQLNRYQSLTVQYTKGVASLFAFNQDFGTITVNQQNNAIREAQITRGGGVQYNLSGPRFSAVFAFLESELEGVFNESFEIQRSINAQIGFSLSHYFQTPLQRQINFLFSTNENDFDAQITNISENKIREVGFRYNHNVSPNLSLSFSAQKRITKQFSIQQPTSSISTSSVAIGFEYRNIKRW